MNLLKQLGCVIHLHRGRQAAAARRGLRAQHMLAENAQRIAERQASIDALRKRRTALWTALPESLNRAAAFRLTRLDAQWRLDEVEHEVVLQELQQERAHWQEEQCHASKAYKRALLKQDNVDTVRQRALRAREAQNLARDESEIEDLLYANRD